VGWGIHQPECAADLSDLAARVIAVEHQDSFARFGVAHLQAALSAQWRQMVGIHAAGGTDGAVRDPLVVSTLMRGRRAPRNWATGALTAANGEHGEAA